MGLEGEDRTRARRVQGPGMGFCRRDPFTITISVLLGVSRPTRNIVLIFLFLPSEPPDQTHHHTLHRNVESIHNDGLHGRVRWLEPDPVSGLPV